MRGVSTQFYGSVMKRTSSHDDGKEMASEKM